MKIILYSIVISYILIFSTLSIQRINNYDGTPAFDLAIPDQGIWLMSNFKSPFMTVRGLHLFGDHTPYIYIFFVPLYWMFDSINILLVMQTTFIAIGAVGIYLIAEKTIKGKYSPLLCSIVYLLHPATNFLNMDLLFSDVFAVPLLIFAYYFLITQRYKLATAASILAMMCKEDVAITIIALAAYAYTTKNKRFGLMLGTAAIIFFVVNMFVLLPYFNGFGYFRNLYGYNALGKLGPTPLDSIKTIQKNPSILSDILNTDDNKNYMMNMFGPMMFLPLFCLSAMLFIPQLLINLMSGYYYTHFVTYHYTAYILPTMMISYINVISKTKRFKYVLIILTLVSTAYFSYEIGGPFNIIKNPKNIIGAIQQEKFDDIKNYDRLVAEIPPRSSASVSYMFLPHMAHRENIFMFPNPFKPNYWGINGENMSNMKPDYLLVNGDTSKEDELINRFLINGTYRQIDYFGSITLYKKYGDVG